MKNLDPEFIIVLAVIILIFIGLIYESYQEQKLKHQEIMTLQQIMKQCPGWNAIQINPYR